MAHTPPPVAELVTEQVASRPGAATWHSGEDINLLLAWPDERRNRWRAALGASLIAHLLAFIAVLQVEMLVPRPLTRRSETGRTSVTRLYLPPDLLTQHAPNRTKPSKTFD